MKDYPMKVLYTEFQRAARFVAALAAGPLIAVSAAPASLLSANRRPHFVKRGALQSCAIAALLLLPAASQAIDFQFLYADADGQGFFDPVLGEQRRAAMQAAGDEVGHLIAPTYFGETVNVRVTSNPNPNTVLLAAAKPVSFYSAFSTSDPRYQPNTYYPKALADQLHGADVDPGHDAISMSVNTAQPFYYGTDDHPTASLVDFVSTAAHELLHGLGFFDTFRQQGGYGTNADGTFNSQTDLSGFPTIFDRFMNLGTSGSSPLTSLSSGNRAAAITSNNLFFVGPNADAGNAGNAPQLFAPNPFQPGSTGPHTDPTALANDLMNPSNGFANVRKPSPVDRGILRDLGYNISISSTNHNWNGSASPDNRASTAANWTGPFPLPGDALTFQSNPSSAYSVQMDLNLYSLDQLNFTPTAPAYNLHFSAYTSTDFTGAGIINNSTATHTIILESHADNGPNNSSGTAATLAFHSTLATPAVNASAGNTIFQLHAGFTAQHTNINAAPTYDRYNGAAINFYDSSTAATATFTVQGAAGDGAPATYARVNFHDTANANSATFTNQPGRTGYSVDYPSVAGFGGQTNFLDSSDALVATFNNLGQDAIGTLPSGTAGLTNFRNSSTADNATLNNFPATVNGGRGGATQFFDGSTAYHAQISNQATPISGGGGSTLFTDDSSAANATINNLGGASVYGPGFTSFFLRSTAASATINNAGLSGGGFGGIPASTTFHDDSSAGTATIHNLPNTDTGGLTKFLDRSTAGAANIYLDPGHSGTISFNNDSTAGFSHLIANAGPITSGLIEFRNNATADNSTIDLGPNNSNALNLIFKDSTTAANSTISAGFLCNVQFYNSSTAANSNITMNPNSTLIFGGSVYGPPTTSAGNATIHLLGGTPSAGPASASFSNSSTAANATITIDGAAATGGGAAQLTFGSASDAGTSTITLKSPNATAPNPGGILSFFNASTANSARVITESGSSLNINANTPIGSVEGAGTINIGSSGLTVGALGLTTTFSGPVKGSNGALTKTGAGQLTLGGADTYTGLTTVAQGALAINGSTPGPVQVNSGATLKGTGTISGTVTCQAGSICAPGNSPGTITVGGLNLMSDSTLEYELGATRDHIVLTNNGNIIVGGLLDLSLLNGFSPALGETFSLFEGSIGSITGAFSAMNAPIFNGHALNLVYGANQVTLEVGEAGDFNGDGTVTAADYVVWRNGLGTIYTQNDYDVWRAHFGQSAGSGAGTSTNATVPEPATLVLLTLAAAGWYILRG